VPAQMHTHNPLLRGGVQFCARMHFRTILHKVRFVQFCAEVQSVRQTAQRETSARFGRVHMRLPDIVRALATVLWQSFPAMMTSMGV
jgi:hypothetical protein